MARVTRSHKIIIAEDDTAIASQIALPPTPTVARAPLSQIHNNYEDAMTVQDLETETELKDLKAAYKTALGVKKNKKSKNKKKARNGTENDSQQAAEDEQPVVAPNAVEDVRQAPSSDEGASPLNVQPQNAPQAGRPTRQQLAKAHQAEESCPDEIRSVGDRDGDVDMTYSPLKTAITIATLEEVEKAYEEKLSAPMTSEELEDSFVENIITRSPAKTISRIEDSVEALDELEEALEALDEATLAQKLVSPEKKKKQPKLTSTSGRVASPTVRRRLVARVPAVAKEPVTRPPLKDPAMVRGKSQTLGRRAINPTLVEPKSLLSVKRTKSTSDIKASISPAGTREAVAPLVPKKKPVKCPASLLPPKQSVRSVKPATLSTFELPGEAIARRLKEQREARKAQRESQEAVAASTAPQAPKVRSTKPLTKPAFELPGEALSRRKREAHEARLKVQEEEERQRREFKAKPHRKSIVPSVTPRDTLASLARRSQIGISENDAFSLATGMPYSSLSVSKRGSIVGAHRPSILATNMANISAPRSPGNAPNMARKLSTTNGPSMTGLLMQRSVSVNSQRHRAKEIYNRDMKAIEDVERERKEREAAAKKSREDAAERGRQASREWAEKQRLKKMTEGDKGLSAGYGPGGQMGLKTTA